VTVDLGILGPAMDGRSRLTIKNEAVEGIDKLLQKAMILLFTDASVESSLGLGTSVPDDVVSANIGDLVVLQNVFHLATASVRDNIFATQSPELPDDEKLSEIAAEVIEGDIAGSAEVTIIVTAVSGDQTKRQTPITNLTITGASDG